MALGILTCSFSLFLFSAGRKNSPAHKSLVGNQGGDNFMCRKSRFPFFPFLLVTFSYFVQILSSLKTFLFTSLSSSNLDREFPFLFLFFCFLPIFGWEFLFLLSSDLWSGIFFFLSLSSDPRSGIFLLKHICRLTVNGSSFLGRSFCSFFRGPGQNFPSWVKAGGRVRFWLEGLAERLDMMYVNALVWPAVQG